MSEYQYYEFRAVDRPLTKAEQDDVRTLSSRVEPTPTEAVFTYSYGDFRGNPLRLLEKYYDAMLYVANWGSKQVAFRLPRALVDVDRLKLYGGYDEVTVTLTQAYVLLDISFHQEGGYSGWVDGEGLLPTLLPLRDDILRGDLRAVYLAWRQGAHNSRELEGYDDEDAVLADEDGDADAESPDELPELPVPAGLGQLSPALRSFVEFFEIDADLIEEAAAASAPLESVDADIAPLVTLLPEDERVTWLVRLARGEQHLGGQLVRRLRELDARR